MFNISKTTVRKLVYCTLRSLAAVLEWPFLGPQQRGEKNMPLCFSEFSEVHVIFDCKVVEVEKSHCASCRILTYSHYKATHTAEVFVGVSYAGLITFVSSAFGGRAFDKACVEKSQVLQKLTSFQDDLMVDKEFKVDEMCTKLGLDVIQPPFLSSQQQFSAADTSITLKIARAGIHVERVIQKMKVFNVLKSPVPWEMTGPLDQIFTVIGGIVDLSKSILSDERC